MRTNLFPIKSKKINRKHRENLLNQKGLTIWLTGLSGSGKSTIALNLEEYLIKSGFIAYVLNGDNIRQGLNKNLGFSQSDRKENTRRIGELCCLFSDAGLITIASLISPYEKDRLLVRKLHQEQKLPFFEIFVDTPLAICQKNDIKGLYKKAHNGEIKEFTGISSLYEIPKQPDLILHPQEQTINDCCNEIIKMLVQQRYLKNLIK